MTTFARSLVSNNETRNHGAGVPSTVTSSRLIVRFNLAQSLAYVIDDFFWLYDLAIIFAHLPPVWTNKDHVDQVADLNRPGLSPGTS